MLRVAALVLLGFTGSFANGADTTAVKKDEPVSYEAAYQQAQKERKPLLVLVGADWCHACKTMKTDTIVPMKEAGHLKEVVYTQIDKDKHPEIASQIMQGNTLPQIVVFCESDKGWKKFSLTGIQTERRVKELLTRAFEAIPKRR
jgi:thiol:disulfide interchange protein